MEVAAFVCPLSKKGLQELGRLTVNFGLVEFLLEYIVALRSGIEDEVIQALLISPLTTRRKLEIISITQSYSKNEETRSLIDEARKIMDKATTARNDILHGYWSFSTDDDPSGVAAVRSTKKRDRAVDASEISRVADEAAKATRLIFTAMMKANDVVLDEPFPLRFWTGKTPPPGWQPEQP